MRVGSPLLSERKKSCDLLQDVFFYGIFLLNGNRLGEEKEVEEEKEIEEEIEEEVRKKHVEEHQIFFEKAIEKWKVEKLEVN